MPRKHRTPKVQQKGCFYLSRNTIFLMLSAFVCVCCVLPAIAPSNKSGNAPSTPTVNREKLTFKGTDTPSKNTVDKVDTEYETPRLTVDSSVMNMRSGPGTTYAVLYKLIKGDTATIVGRNDDSTWWVIEYEEKQGWVSADNTLSTVTGSYSDVEVIDAPPSPVPGSFKTKIPSESTARPASTVRPSRTPVPQPTVAPQQPSYPAGATAKCNDGSYSFAAHHQGACSHHGGVAVWYK